MSCYVKHKVNWMEARNIKLSNWMRKRQLYVSRKSLFWGLISVHPQCVVIWTLWFIFFIGFGIELLFTVFREAFRSVEPLPEIVIYSLDYLKFTTDSHWQWKKTIKKLYAGVHPLFVPLLLLHRWLLLEYCLLKYVFICVWHIYYKVHNC